MMQKSELFERIAEGHRARITVVTTNQRLAHSLTLEFDDYQLARGPTSWEAADILPFGAFVERLWEDALYSPIVEMSGSPLPLLLTPAQEQHLWERILAASGLLIVPQAAAQCRDAWRLIHQWRIGTGPGNDDALAFGQWSSAYKKETQSDIDAARLPDLMAGYLDQLKKPALVDAALTLIELAFTPIDFARASHLIRSPYIGGADTELARRASLDVRIRRDADSTIGLAKLVAAAEPAPLLRKLLECVFDITKTKVDSPADWARQFSALLEAAGFPGERTLDSDEFQTRAKWHEMLGELAKLERISSQMPFPAAFATLKGLCADTLFQPETPDAPIQILGVIESQDQRFDCLWVSGPIDDTWPGDARP